MGDVATLIGRKKFGADFGIQDIFKHAANISSRPLRFVSHEVLYKRLRNGAVDAVHGHVIAVIGRPTERELAQIAGADHKPARFVCDIHQNERAHARLGVFIRDVGDVAVVTYVLEVSEHAFGYIHSL